MSTVRAASAADLDAIVRIAERSFSRPWNREAFAADVSRSWAAVLVVGDDHGDVVGFTNVWHVEDEIEVMNVATDPAYRRRGHGRALVVAVLDLARRVSASFVILEVRGSNAAAIALYESFGFVCEGRRERYYDDGEDAILMRVKVAALAEPR